MMTGSYCLRLVVPFLAVLLSSCSSAPVEEPAADLAAVDDGVEEVECDLDEVSEIVRDRADLIASGLGPGVGIERWCWDREDNVWECAVTGLSRSVELDLDTGGGFSEIEYVFGFDEVVHALPNVAEMVRETCRDVDGTLLELSLRREDLIVRDPDLAASWSGDDVFMEIQCPDGQDFEVDPYGSTTMRPDDDIDEPVPPTRQP
jgi:hypothetical protein